LNFSGYPISESVHIEILAAIEDLKKGKVVTDPISGEEIYRRLTPNTDSASSTEFPVTVDGPSSAHDTVPLVAVTSEEVEQPGDNAHQLPSDLVNFLSFSLEIFLCGWFTRQKCARARLH
jgi:hypothetical protein